MAFSGWGSKWSIDAKWGRVKDAVQGWPLTLLALLLGFGFFSAGFPKLLRWADFDLATQGARSWLVNGWYGMDRRELLAPMFMGINNPYFWETVDLLAVTFEVGFMFSLVRRGLFRTFLFIAVMFHFVNVLMLNIGFLTLLPVFLVLAPWERLLPHLPGRLTNGLDRVASWPGMAVLFVFFLPLYFLIGQVPVDTAFSHLGILAWLAGLDYEWGLTLTIFPTAVIVALALSGLPVGRQGPSDLPTDKGKIVFFDGACNLCIGLIDRLVRRGEQGLRFASLQSELGNNVNQAILRPRADNDYQSVLLVDVDGKIYERSDAILKLLIPLGGVYRLLGCLWLVPRPIRDLSYRIVSFFRYRIFGKRETCRVPTAEERELFL